MSTEARMMQLSLAACRTVCAKALRDLARGARLLRGADPDTIERVCLLAAHLSDTDAGEDILCAGCHKPTDTDRDTCSTCNTIPPPGAREPDPFEPIAEGDYGWLNDDPAATSW